ncbi:MAG: hypothetical protein LBS33_07180 [Streptococcaceae bacterium]|jgi:phage-related minor tail protein|nr:hypothetical protein [Streptococcaceae bacterium]
MTVDKSANERFELGRQINEKEHQMTSLAVDKRKSRETLENLESSLAKNFRKLEELNTELSNAGSKTAQWSQSEDEGMRKALSRLLSSENEKLTKIFNKTIQNLEEERGQLREERSNLPWD